MDINIKKIVNAWLTSFNPTKEEKELAEKRYDISSDQNINFSSFQKFIQTKTNGLIENKKYNSFVKEKKVVMSGVGLVNLKNIWPNIKTYNVKNSNDINNLAQSFYLVNKPFYLFIDKELVKAKQISWLNITSKNLQSN